MIAFVVGTITTPAGVSGAVFLLPIQISLLGVPSPAVTPTNLLYNVVATPGGLLRFRRAGTLQGALARRLVLGTLPGVVVGALLRVEFLSGLRAFYFVIAAVLLPLGLWLALTGPGHRDPGSPEHPGWLPAVAFGVGVVGGIYGIGGGSILAPLLLTVGYSVLDVAGASLASTFLTSIAGIAVFEALALRQGGRTAIAPDWAVGLALGAGGLLGSYLGARLQPYLPERALRRLLGCLAVLIAVRYAWIAAT